MFIQCYFIVYCMCMLLLVLCLLCGPPLLCVMFSCVSSFSFMFVLFIVLVLFYV